MEQNFCSKNPQDVDDYLSLIWTRDASKWDEFRKYLKKEYSEGKIDFSIRMGDDNSFYIHAMGKDSETLDMKLFGENNQTIN
jgi:hypothetical protein